MERQPSNKSKGKFYYERLLELRDLSEASGATVENGRKVRRSWIVANLGCSEELLSSNAKIRRTIKDWDHRVAQRRSAASKIVEENRRLDGEASASNVIQMRKKPCPSKLLDGKIRWNTVIDAAGNEHRVPVLLAGGQIDENASNWFRYLTIYKDYEPSSVEEALKIHRSFKMFIRKQGVEELEVSDEVFVLWRNSMKSRVEPKRINECLSSVHAYYRYLEETGIIRYRVQIYEADQLPPLFRPPYAFPITSKPVVRRSDFGVETRSWTSPFKVSVSNSSTRETPTNEKMKRVHARAKGQKHAVRNSLLLSLTEKTGGRVSELLQIRLSQLPDPARLMEIIQEGLVFKVFVKRKRRKKPMPLVLDKYLLIRIVNYVDKERAEIVRRYPDTAGKSDSLFLGDRGNELKADSVTHLVIDLFFGIIENAGIHRLRSKFAIDKLETLITGALELGIDVGPTSNWVENFLQIVAEEMGQASILSLRPYLPLVFGRKLATTKAAALRDNERQLLETERLLADQDLRLKKQVDALRMLPSLEEAARLIAENRKLDAADKLAHLAATLRSEAA